MMGIANSRAANSLRAVLTNSVARRAYRSSAAAASGCRRRRTQEGDQVGAREALVGGQAVGVLGDAQRAEVEHAVDREAEHDRRHGGQAGQAIRRNTVVEVDRLNITKMLTMNRMPSMWLTTMARLAPAAALTTMTARK
jgi:hypothetical protein